MIKNLKVLMMGGRRCGKTTTALCTLQILDDISLDSVGCLSGIIGDGQGDVHIVGLCELSAPQDECFTCSTVGADGLVEVVDVNVGNIKVAGVQAAQEALQLVLIVDAILLGVYQANAISKIVSQLLAVLDADHIAVCLSNSSVDGVDQLLGLAGALQAHNNMNHRNVLLLPL